MKKILSLIFCAAILIGAANAQPKMITISEEQLTAIIADEVNRQISVAIDKAVRLVVIEYENKILDYKQQLIDKDITIANEKADKELAQAAAIKFEKLYNIEKLNSNKTGLIIGIGAVTFFLGYGLNALIP